MISIINKILLNSQHRLFQRTLENKLQKLDSEEGKDEEINKIFSQLQRAYQREVIQLKKKSRVKWDLEGDCNTGFFHRAIQQRRRSNHIHRLRWN